MQQRISRGKTWLSLASALAIATCGAFWIAHSSQRAFAGERHRADSDGEADSGGSSVCERTAKLQRKAERAAARADFANAIAKCLNLRDAEECEACREEARAQYREERELIRERFEARVALCEEVGEDPYDPAIDPARFTSEINHPLFPLPVGATWTYESQTEDGLETTIVEVLDATREIMAVECRAVRDTVYVDEEVTEDTTDWYAQDDSGNVWYFGETSFSYEDGFVESLEGSWLAGKDGAKPGILMEAAPQPGDSYRQEWLLGEAEDAATVLDVDASITIGLGTFVHCVQTADFTPIEPDVVEHKYYAPGIGVVAEVNPETGERVELVSYSGL